MGHLRGGWDDCGIITKAEGLHLLPNGSPLPLSRIPL